MVKAVMWAWTGQVSVLVLVMIALVIAVIVLVATARRLRRAVSPLEAGLGRVRVVGRGPVVKIEAGGDPTAEEGVRVKRGDRDDGCRKGSRNRSQSGKSGEGSRFHR